MVTGKKQQLISIVAPAFNEEEGLEEFVIRLKTMMDRQKYAYEFVLVNDGSCDNTLGVMRTLKRTVPQIAIVNLSQNFGKEIAMTAGLENTKGEAVIIIDTDLQYPGIDSGHAGKLGNRV